MARGLLAQQVEQLGELGVVDGRVARDVAGDPAVALLCGEQRAGDLDGGAAEARRDLRVDARLGLAQQPDAGPQVVAGAQGVGPARGEVGDPAVGVDRVVLGALPGQPGDRVAVVGPDAQLAQAGGHAVAQHPQRAGVAAGDEHPPAVGEQRPEQGRGGVGLAGAGRALDHDPGVVPDGGDGPDLVVGGGQREQRGVEDGAGAAAPQPCRALRRGHLAHELHEPERQGAGGVADVAVDLVPAPVQRHRAGAAHDQRGRRGQHRVRPRGPRPARVDRAGGPAPPRQDLDGVGHQRTRPRVGRCGGAGVLPGRRPGDGADDVTGAGLGADRHRLAQHVDVRAGVGQVQQPGGEHQLPAGRVGEAGQLGQAVGEALLTAAGALAVGPRAPGRRPGVVRVADPGGVDQEGELPVQRAAVTQRGRLQVGTRRLDPPRHRGRHRRGRGRGGAAQPQDLRAGPDRAAQLVEPQHGVVGVDVGDGRARRRGEGAQRADQADHLVAHLRIPLRLHPVPRSPHRAHVA
ncbi:hypothetical protein GCM10010210_09150 [Pseudonocardia hydrocarbonoxydans]|uniref:Uncharacterized protein n=1 Tax=Pseudonocardia hydrocarbonoxydans TaxID=76726 RepID=A0A4Y3WLR3_9PSEU|nr:hypothetical protein PHY01_21150 [Pseudonocardia hydrocarbonoxydans]